MERSDPLLPMSTSIEIRQTRHFYSEPIKCRQRERSEVL